MIDARLMRLPQVRKVMVGLGVLTFVQAAVIVGQAYFLTAAIVHLWHQQALSTLWPLVAGFALMYAVRQLISYARDMIASRFARHLADDFHEQLMAKLYELGPQVMLANGVGELVTVGLDGIIEVQTYLELIVGKMLDMMIIPVVVLIAIALQSVKAGIALLVLFPVIILFMVILGLAARDQSKRQYAGFVQLANHFTDTLRGLKTLRFLGLSHDYAQNVYSVSETYRKQTMVVLRTAMLSSFAMDFFSTIAIAIVAVFLGIDLLNGTQVLFPALLALILAPEYFMPIREFGNDYHATLNGKNALAAVWQLLDQPKPVVAPALPNYTWDAHSRLKVQTLSYHYDQQAGVQDLDFELRGHQTIGIIGTSGAGKSTVLNLLAGNFAPDAGTPFTLNGTPLATLRQADWQQHLSYIPQTPYLFAATIAANVRLYRPDATSEEVAAAVQAAGLAAWIDQLPEGLQTTIGEGGRALSGGQAQRIALARTLLDDRRDVWLFDEPTAHLDIETEARLKATMQPLFADKLVVMATHRLHWLEAMDWVLVMAGGQIVAQGTPEDLQAHSAAFKRLTNQMRGEFNVAK
ncbi:thiol reductant ABC exporter subunit CydD [Lacticaseibacillus sp. GG6-2]